MLTRPACRACLRRPMPVPGHPGVPDKPVGRARIPGARPFVIEVPTGRFHPAFRAGEVDAAVVEAQRGRVALQLAQQGGQRRCGPRAKRLVGRGAVWHNAWHRARESLAGGRHAPRQGQGAGQVSFLAKQGFFSRSPRRRLAAGRDLSGEGSGVGCSRQANKTPHRPTRRGGAWGTVRGDRTERT